MAEISKLRQRLSNIGRNVFEYKMTVAEAQQLLKEIDELSKPAIVEEVKVEEKKPTVIYRVMDGGSL